MVIATDNYVSQSVCPIPQLYIMVILPADNANQLALVPLTTQLTQPLFSALSDAPTALSDPIALPFASKIVLLGMETTPAEYALPPATS